MLKTFLITALCCGDIFMPKTSNKFKEIKSARNFLDPHFTEGHKGIVQLFEWKWNDIASECETFLSLMGYGGVQISPPNENVIIYNRPWYERYQPISYLIKTRSGDEKSFLDMTQRCNKVGVRIYVDVVINHMAADQPSKTAVGTGGSNAKPDIRDYPFVPYNVTNFHPPCPLIDFNDRYQVRNCELVGLHDLNQTIEDTRNKIVGYLNHLIDLGVAGFRVDAAKHIWPNDLQIIYNRLNFLNTSFGFDARLNPFIYQEVFDSGNEAVSKFEYTFAAVTEFRYALELARSFTRNDQLKWLSGFGGKWGLLPSKYAVVFINNHDTQRSGGVLTYKNGKSFIMAQAFSLSHPFGTKRIMSSFDFDKVEEGPPNDGKENILSPTFDENGQCNNGWVCEHRWPQIASMVEFMNVVDGENITTWWDNGSNQIAFSRGSKGFIVFNLETDSMKDVLIQTSLKSGIYCDVASGRKTSNNSCSGKKLIVSSEGLISIDLQSDDLNGFIAIHTKQKLD
ncbi:CLUMA_CG007353, isoform A [Clunio marinus]|uniref:Alpha-amylase n=1 Tax=Clunio marinus TaxID=568069 RepID=A0A1J1I235_9DIPT|nr:CLUMA_CG007353, isoform A [Clunio marinus]